jgi:hypothetical protein
MSMFYCTAHDTMEDSDFVGYHVTREGEEMCDDAADEVLGWCPYTMMTRAPTRAPIVKTEGLTTPR